MSILDKAIAAVTPLESDSARAEVRSKALAAARPGDWLSRVIEHHKEIEAAFAAVKSATTAAAQATAQKKLAVLLTGHSIAEEAVLYPALVGADEKTYATTAYTEQSAAKTQMGLLETLEPLSEEYMDKLEHIRGAVAHHVYEEEKTWFYELQEKLAEPQRARLLARYDEEFNRYVNGDSHSTAAGNFAGGSSFTGASNLAGTSHAAGSGVNRAAPADAADAYRSERAG